jgi:hypothetical protein
MRYLGCRQVSAISQLSGGVVGCAEGSKMRR